MSEEKQEPAKKRRFFKDTPLEWKWMLYDVGNSAFTLLASVILPIYFSYLAGQSGVDETSASTIWSFAASGITLTEGKPRSSTSSESSVEPLSATTTSTPSAGVWRSSTGRKRCR